MWVCVHVSLSTLLHAPARVLPLFEQWDSHMQMSCSKDACSQIMDWFVYILFPIIRGFILDQSSMKTLFVKHVTGVLSLVQNVFNMHFDRMEILHTLPEKAIILDV